MYGAARRLCRRRQRPARLGDRRGEFREDGEVRDVSDPIRIIGAKRDELKYDANWAENFTRLTSEGKTGLAHYESVVFGNYPRYRFNR